MLGERFAQWLRFGAVALFSIVLASCGDGSGEDSIDPSADEAAAAEMRLVFADYFGDPPTGGSRAIAKAPLPAGNWVVDTGYGPNDDGNGNDEWQLYTNSMENVFTENGNLVLRAQCTDGACNAPVNKRNGTITSGKILSKDRVNVQFGNVRARIKMPSGGGMWPAFWMLGADIDQRPWPDAGEIDIVELFYYFSDNRTTHFTAHWAGPPREDGKLDSCSNPAIIPIDPNEVQRCQTASKEFKAKDGFPPLTDDFHIFELEWNEGSIVGKIDGITYYSLAIDASTMEEFLKEYFMILNVAVGGTLGGQQGPWMTVSDWSDPNQTDMLVDWVEVWERVPATSATLIDETGKNIRYNGILNSINSGGGLVEVNLKSVDVPALVGSQTMSIRFSNTFTGVPGSRPVTFSGATFDFTGKNFSDFDSFQFSLDSSRFAGFKDLGVQLEDRDGKKILIRTAGRYLTATNGVWRTYSIPLADFPGIDMNNITGIGFFNPYDTSGNLAAGTVYFDDIRFTRSTAQCNAAASIEFDSVNYNPETNVGSILVDDPCARNSLALVEVLNDTSSIFVGVKLDAAGKGETQIGLLKGNSVCSTSDRDGFLQLSGQLMATYSRSSNARGGAANAFAAAGIDDSAPVVLNQPWHEVSISMSEFADKNVYDYLVFSSNNSSASNFTYLITDIYLEEADGERKYIYGTGREPDFIPDTEFFFSDFGSDSSFNGNFTDDEYFSPVFSVSDNAGEQAVLALFGFIDGFTSNTTTINFKVRNMPGNFISVKFGQDGGPDSTFGVDLENYSGSARIDNGEVPAECAVEESTGGGGAGPGIIPDDVLYATDPGETVDLVFGVDYADIAVFSSGAMLDGNHSGDADFNPAFAVTTGNGYGPEVAQLAFVGFATGFAAAYDTLDFKVKGMWDNQIKVELLGSGGGATTIDLTSSGFASALGNGWYQVSIPITSIAGDASAADGLLFQNTDASSRFTFLLTDMGFSSGGGGGGAGPGIIPDDVLYATDPGETVDLVFGVDYADIAVFSSGAMLDGNHSGDADFNPAFAVTTGNGYGPEVAQLAFVGFATGFAAAYDTLDFKVKGMWDNQIKVELLGSGGGATTIDLTSSGFASALGNGWYQVSIPITSIAGDASAADGLLFQNTDASSRFTFLLTDMGFSSGGGGGGAGPGIIPDDVLYATDPGETVDLVFGVDYADIAVFSSGAMLDGNHSGDADFNPAFAVTTGNGYGPEVAQLAFVGFATGFAAAYDTLDFKVKGMWDNQIKVELLGSGGGATTIDLTSSGFASALGNGWYQVSIPITSIAGDASAADGLLFQNTDASSRFTFLLTDMGFSSGGGGGGAGPGIIPDDVLYATDPGETVDLVFGVDYADIAVFSSGAMLDGNHSGDADFNPAFAVTTGNGYGPEVAQLAFVGFATGFAAAYDTLDFKVKGMWDNQIKVELLGSGGGATTIDLTSSGFASALGNGWYQVSIPITSIAGDASAADGLLFQNTDASSRFTFLLTDMGFSSGGGGGGGGVGQQLAVNGDFEAGDGDLSDWVVVPNGGTIAAVDTQDSGSVWSVNLAADGSGGSPFISLAGLGAAEVMPGDNVYVSFDMCGTLAGDGGAIKIALLSEKGVGNGSDRDDLEIFVSSPPSVWTRYEYTTQASANVTDGVSLQLEAACGAVAGCGVNVYFDNVSIILGGDPPASQTASGESCAVIVPPVPTEPTVAAPTPPARAPVDVISLFSNAYTDGTVDTWAAGFSNTSFADVQIAGNDTKEYTAFGFAGIEFLNANSIDITGMTHFHFDVWTSNVPDFLFKVVNFNGAGGFESESVFTINAGSTPALDQGSWVSVDIPITQLQTFGLGATPNDVSQLIIDGIPDGGAVYLDNVYFYNSAGGVLTSPPVAAPTPQVREAGDVISLFSNAYTDVPVDTWAAGFSNTSFADVQIAGDDTKEYTAFGFAGIELTGANSIDITGMTHFHFDIWTPDVPDFLFKVVNFNGAGAFESESVTTINAGSTPALTPGSWVSVDIPITQLQADGLGATPNDVSQLIIDGIPDGGAVYLDNVYFYKPGLVTVPPDAAPTPPARAPADVISLFSNAYMDVPVDTWAAGFSNTSFSDVQIAGDDTKEYTAFGFAGIELLGANSIDITGMTHFHFDIWTPDVPDFLFKVVNFNGAGGFESESSTTINAGSTPVLGQGVWVSVDIPITQLQTDGLGVTPNDVSQLIIDGIPDGGAVYLDNVYFYATGATADLVNGSFETGDFSGWTEDPDAGGTLTAGTITHVASGPDSRANVARLEAAGNAINGPQDVLLTQVVGTGAINAGDTIDVSFDLYGSLSGAGGVVFVELVYLDGSGAEAGRNFLGAAAPYTPNLTWTNHSGSKTAGIATDGSMVSVDGGVRLDLKAACGAIVNGCGVDAYFDNVTFSVTP